MSRAKKAESCKHFEKGGVNPMIIRKAKGISAKGFFRVDSEGFFHGHILSTISCDPRKAFDFERVLPLVSGEESCDRADVFRGQVLHCQCDMGDPAVRVVTLIGCDGDGGNRFPDPAVEAFQLRVHHKSDVNHRTFSGKDTQPIGTAPQGAQASGQ